MKNVLLAFTVMMLFGSCVEQDVIGIAPGDYELKQNAPNPFTDTTLIQYGIPNIGTNGPHIRIVVFNHFNDVVAVLRDSSSHPAGTFNITWRSLNTQPYGVYYIELQKYPSFLPLSETVKRIAVLKQ